MRSYPRKADVVIAGGSVAGYTSCLALKAANPKLKIVVLEPRNLNKPFGASIAIGVNGIKALKAIEPKAAARLQNIDAGLNLVKMLDGEGNLLNDLQQPEGAVQRQQLDLFGAHSVLGVYKQVSDSISMEIPSDVKIIRGKVCDFEQGTESVAVRFEPMGNENNEDTREQFSIESSLLVGADGYKSKVRQLLFQGRRFEPNYCGQFVMWGTAECSKNSLPQLSSSYNVLNGPLSTLMVNTDPVACVFFGPGDALSHVGYRYNHRANLLIDNRTGRQASKREVAQAIIGSQSPHVQQYVNALNEDAMILRGTLRHTLKQWSREVYGRGRVVVLGDAAHAMLPDGRAGSQAIEDAYWLGKIVQQQGLNGRVGRSLGRAREKRVKLCLEIDENREGVFERYYQKTGVKVDQQLYTIQNPFLFTEEFESLRTQGVEMQV